MSHKMHNIRVIAGTALISLALFTNGCGMNNTNPSTTELKPELPFSNKDQIKKNSSPQRSIRRLGSTEISAIKPLELKTGRFDECGAESFNLKEDILCGVQDFNLRSTSACPAIVQEAPQFGPRTFRESSGEACGAAEYFSKPDESCGFDDEEFWSEWNKSCPSGYAGGSWYSALANTETRVNRVSWTDVRIETRHLCKRRTLKTCERPEFGVKKFKTCRHPSFGTESFNSGVVGYEVCRHESHGVERFKSCRHETFGVEQNKSCSLYMTQLEMDGYVRAQTDVLPAISSTMIDAASIYYSAAGKQRALACLVKSVIDDPTQKELAEELKDRYFVLADKFWTEDEAKECDRGFVEIDDAQCNDTDTTIRCTALKSFRAARSAFITSRRNLTLLSQEARERGNKAASEAVQDLLSAVRDQK